MTVCHGFRSACCHRNLYVNVKVHVYISRSEDILHPNSKISTFYCLNDTDLILFCLATFYVHFFQKGEDAVLFFRQSALK